MFKDMALGRVGGLEPLLYEQWLMEYDSDEVCDLPQDRTLHVLCVAQIAAYHHSACRGAFM